MRRIVLVMAGAACLLIVASAAFLMTQNTERPAPAAALNIGGADIGGPFTLVDHTGVERSDQADRLRDLGCDLLQGYYFSKPRPFAEIMDSTSGDAASRG